MENIFLETERIILRKMTNNDFNELALILKNKEIMAAWEYDFEDKDVHEGLKRIMNITTASTLVISLL